MQSQGQVGRVHQSQQERTREGKGAGGVWRGGRGGEGFGGRGSSVEEHLVGALGEALRVTDKQAQVQKPRDKERVLGRGGFEVGQ